jgi:hypothetical protein
MTPGENQIRCRDGHLLADGDQPRNLQTGEMATGLESQWASMATALGIVGDYFGYFETPWTSKIESVLDDMLTEASPRPCSKEAALAEQEWASDATPFLNRAWKTARSSFEPFATWEPAALSARLVNDNV